MTLSSRIEAASADQQRELLVEAWRAIHGKSPAGTMYDCGVHGTRPGHPDRMLAEQFNDCLNAEAFIDAALTLVPEGWMVVRLWELRRPMRDKRGVWNCQIEPRDIRSGKVIHSYDAATPALALAAAAIKIKEGHP